MQDRKARFDLQQGSGAPGEYYLIDFSNPKVAGLVDAAMGFVDFPHEMATITV
ncbi:MAG: hypothetical protein ACKVS5_15100 [Parvularculaceae bacterium]